MNRNYKIGIVGSCGIVGSAHKFGFEKMGWNVACHDIQLGTSIENILNTDLCFICVPTPLKEGKLDISIVDSVVSLLVSKRYLGLIIIKSTVNPGDTRKLAEKYDIQNICCSCETLRERYNLSDFMENHKLLVVGTLQEWQTDHYNKIRQVHQDIAKDSVHLTCEQCELLKLFHNNINALRVVWANECFDICEKLDVEYDPIRRALLKTTGLPNEYLFVVKDKVRSFSSICFGKDIPALTNLGKSLELNLPIMFNIDESNNRHQKTPFGNTRE